MVALISRLSSGGKRVRALLAYHSFVFAGGDPADPRILDLGAAIEFFQTAALIHDDILDRSDTRRGQPSVHRAFEALHAESGWGLDREHFGVSAAILTGDLALALADECFSAVETAPGTRLRRQFNRMKWEVMAGQYLDIVEEVAAPVSRRNVVVEVNDKRLEVSLPEQLLITAGFQHGGVGRTMQGRAPRRSATASSAG